MFSQKFTIALVFLASTVLSKLLIRFKTKFTHLCLVTVPGVLEKLHHGFILMFSFCKHTAQDLQSIDPL